jgi:hypothetical protein
MAAPCGRLHSRGLEGEIVSRARALIKAEDAEITLSEHGRLWWSGAVVASLAASAHPLTPAIELLADELLKGELRAEVTKRLEDWLRDHIARALEPLVALKNAAEARTSAWEQGGLPGRRAAWLSSLRKIWARSIGKRHPVHRSCAPARKRSSDSASGPGATPFICRA